MPVHLHTKRVLDALSFLKPSQCGAHLPLPLLCEVWDCLENTSDTLQCALVHLQIIGDVLAHSAAVLNDKEAVHEDRLLSHRICATTGHP